VNQKYYVRLIPVPPDALSLQGQYSTQFDQITGGRYSTGRLQFEYIEVTSVTDRTVSFRSFGGSVLEQNGQTGGMFNYARGSNSLHDNSESRRFSVGVGATGEGVIVELQYGSPTINGRAICEGIAGPGPHDAGTVCRIQGRYIF